MRDSIVETVPLGDVVDVIGGGTPSKRNPGFYGGDIPWATVRDMNVEHLQETEHSITSEGLQGSSSKIIPKGEIVIATRVGLGKVCILGQDTAINQDLRGLVPKCDAEIDRRFLFHWYTSIADKVIDAGTGATVQGVKLPFVKSLPFPTLTLEEQQRIVAVLDEAFEGLARARAHAEANLQNAQELFENFLGALFTRHDADWISAPLQEIVESDCSLSYGIVQPGDNVAGGLPIVRPTDLGRRTITLDGLKRIDPAKADGYARTKLKGTEILLCVRGSTGVVAMASEELDGANVTRGIVPIRFDPEKMDQRLGYYQFLSKPVQDQIKAGTYGAALMQINIRDLRKLTFFVPPVAQQEVLLERLDSVANDFDTLVKDYTRKVSDTDDLRQSLLQKAFAGELTKAEAA